MKSKLLLFYSMFLNTYYYNQNKDEETSRKYAFTAVRNLVGAVIFMSSIVIYVVAACIFELNISFLNRPLLYSVSAICVYIYYLISKSFLKPLFENVQLKKEKPPKNHFFVITVVLAAIFGGGMYLLGRLLTIYLCG